MAPRKARVEGAQADPAKVTTNKPLFAALVERFKAEYPEEWEQIRLCPAESSLAVMADKLG